MVVVFPISGHLKLKEPTLGVHVFEHTSTRHQSFSSISFGKDYDAIYFDLKDQDWGETIQTICADQFDTKVCWELTDMALLKWYNDILIKNKMNEWMNEWMNDDYALRSTFGTMQFLVYSLFAGDIGSCNYTNNHN